MYQAEATEGKVAEALNEAADLSMALARERARLRHRLCALEAWTHELELGVARAREAAARHPGCDGELGVLHEVQSAVRRELRDGAGPA